MKVTIITVTYNSETYLNQCIDSVISQDYKDIEYILIDGASLDNTINIINQYKDKIYKWVSDSDNGIYDAINKGIRLATGDIIGILNSDDFFADNNVISRVVQTFNGSSALKAVYADVNFVDKFDSERVIRYYSSRRFQPWMFKFGFQPAHPSFYIRKEVFDQYGVYRTDLMIAGDFELLMRFLLRYKIKYNYIEDIWVKMRIGGASTSGLKSVFRVNNEILTACKANHIYTNKIMIYSKYLIKWWGFMFKKIS